WRGACEAGLGRGIIGGSRGGETLIKPKKLEPPHVGCYGDLNERVNRISYIANGCHGSKTNCQTIVQRLQAAGHQAFWVGGCVRDFLLGREPQDFDIATDAKPDQVEKLFKRTIAVGKKFGVIVV